MENENGSVVESSEYEKMQQRFDDLQMQILNEQDTVEKKKLQEESDELEAKLHMDIAA